jgi:HEAT repeat protein
MTIRASSAKEVGQLIADLAAPKPVAREAAIARLTIIGSRAVARLAALAASDASSDARVAALRALEGIGDPRALSPGLKISGDRDDRVAGSAIALLRTFIRSESGAAVVDHLSALALDRGRPVAVRLAAINAIQDLGPSTARPLVASLVDDPDLGPRLEGALEQKGAKTDPNALLDEAIGRGLPDDPAALRTAIASEGHAVPLTALHQIVERVREREDVETGAARDKWTAVRAAAHLALAKRHSRLALYDLREALEKSTRPLPVDALAALSLIGDASCVEAIAASYARTNDEWWRDRLRDTFRAIVEREGLTRRSAAVKRVERKRKGALDLLWTAEGTRAPRPRRRAT